MCDECCSKIKEYCWKKCHGQIIIGEYDDAKDKHKRKHRKCHKCRKRHCKCEPAIIFIDDYQSCCGECCCCCCCCHKKCNPCGSHYPPRHCRGEKQWFEWDEVNDKIR